MFSVPNPLAASARADMRVAAAAPAESAHREIAVLYAECAGELLTYALSLGRDEELARDAIQEGFLRYFIALCEGAEIASPRAWIYRVIHNYVLDRFKEPRGDGDADLRLEPARGSDPEDECFRGEVRRLARHALTPREFDCLRLRTEGLRYEEIASTLALSSGTVGALISRAVHKLRETLAGGNGRRS